MYDTVECPYCGYENDMSDGCTDLPDDNKFDHECENCEKEFEVEVEFDPIYSANKIEYAKCECCNREVRGIYERGRVFPFPKVREARLCQKCWFKYMSKELKL